MASFVQGSQVRLVETGLRVNRPTAVVPATGNQNLFAVNGRVILKAIVGQLTVAASATATNLKLQGAPTTGTAVDLCANGLITSKEIGSWLGLTGTFSDALVVASAGAGIFFDAAGIVLSPGFIRAVTDATNTTASVQWTAFYVPLDDGASLSVV